MDVVLAGADSLWVLRRARSDATLGLARGVPAPAKTRAAELAAIADALPDGFRPLGSKAPLDLTYFSRRQRPFLAAVHAVTHLSPVLEDTYLLVTGAGENGVRLFVEGPALTLSHMAERLRVAVGHGSLTRTAAFFRLMGLASELCGTYARDPSNPASGDCAWKVDVLCGPEELRRSLSLASGVRGVAEARRVASLVVGGSASPTESLLAMAMSLPVELGGVPMPAFLHNEELAWPKGARQLVNHQTMTPDFYWPRHAVALEYDGAVHEDRKNVREDHRRQQDYAACDIALVTSQADDLRSAHALERLMRLVALRLAPCEEPGFMLLVEQALQDSSASSMRATLLSQLLSSRPEGREDKKRAPAGDESLHS